MEIATTEPLILRRSSSWQSCSRGSSSEKAEHIKRIVAIAKRGFRRIEKLWDENTVPEARAESLAAATLDKHDAIIRRNLGMNETQGGTGR